MAQHTNIEWTDSSINGSSGCDGCELWTAKTRTCYAGHVHQNRLAKSYPAKYAADFAQVRMIPGRFSQAAGWPDLTGRERPGKPWLNGMPRHIFVGDMGDFLSRDVTDEFLKRELQGAITSPAGSRHVWQLLTKRPERLVALSEAWGGLPDNVVAMTTVTNQRTANVRIPQLQRVRCKVRGISAEPLLGAVDFNSELGGTLWMGGQRGCRGEHHGIGTVDCPRELHHHHDARCGPGLDWVICGGESGTGARPLHVGWVRQLRDQCQAAGVPFFFKQWGDWISNPDMLAIKPSTQVQDLIFSADAPERVCRVYRVGKAAGGRLLDGREHNGFPVAKGVAR